MIAASSLKNEAINGHQLLLQAGRIDLQDPGKQKETPQRTKSDK